MYLISCLSACLSVSIHRNQKNMSDLFKLELQATQPGCREPNPGPLQI